MMDNSQAKQNIEDLANINSADTSDDKFWKMILNQLSQEQPSGSGNSEESETSTTETSTITEETSPSEKNDKVKSY